MIGYIRRVYNPNATNQLEMYPYVFTGETSDWGETQIVTIPEFPSWFFLPLFIIAALAVIIYRNRFRRKSS